MSNRLRRGLARAILTLRDCVCEGGLIVSSNEPCWENFPIECSYCHLTSRTNLLRVILSLGVGSCKNGALGVQFTHQSSLHQQTCTIMLKLDTIHLMNVKSNNATRNMLHNLWAECLPWLHWWFVAPWLHEYWLCHVHEYCWIHLVADKLLVSKCTSWNISFTYAAEPSICQYQSSCLQLPLTTVLRRRWCNLCQWLLIHDCSLMLFIVAWLYPPWSEHHAYTENSG